MILAVISGVVVVSVSVVVTTGLITRAKVKAVERICRSVDGVVMAWQFKNRGGGRDE